MNPIHKITGSRLYTQLATTRKARIVGASAVLLTVVAFGAVAVSPMAPDASDLPVRSIEKPFTLDGKPYAGGAFIVPRAGSPADLDERVRRIAAASGAEVRLCNTTVEMITANTRGTSLSASGISA